MKTKEATNHSIVMEVPRARRYGIVTTIRYRVRGEKTWREGMLKNISMSGLLMAADWPLDEGTNVEMRFTLPVELKGKRAADVWCRGIVIRSEREAAAKGAVNIATRLSFSRLLRQKSDK